MATCIALLCMGCSVDNAEPASPPTDEAEQSASESVDRPEAPPNRLLPDEVVRDIDWEAASNYTQIPRSKAPAKLRETYAKSPVPVLLPDDPEMLNSTFPTVGEHWYSASIELEGAHVVIEASRVARKLDIDVPAKGKKLVDDEFLLTRNEGIKTLSFNEFGAGYSVDVECYNHDSDSRCTEDDFIIGVAEKLAVLGGER